MNPLVFCPNGHVFESRSFVFGGTVRSITLRGNRERCVICNASAEVMDGEVDVVNGTLQVLAAPQTTLDRLRQLQALVSALRDESASPQKVVETLRKEAPELAHALPQDRSQWLVWLAILVSIIGILIQHYDATHQAHPISGHDIDQIIKTVIDHQDPVRLRPPPTALSPTPPTTPPSHPDAPGSTAPPRTPPQE